MKTTKRIRIVREKTASVIGGISCKSQVKTIKKKRAFESNLFKTFLSLCLGGIVIYLVGIENEADMVILEVLDQLKQVFPTIKVIAVPSYIGQEKEWTFDTQEKYISLLNKCDAIRVLDNGSQTHLTDKKNNWLVDHATVCVFCEQSKSNNDCDLQGYVVSSGGIVRIVDFD